jgi:hypothetical protein
MHTPRSLGPLAQSLRLLGTERFGPLVVGQCTRDGWDLRRKEQWADLREQRESCKRIDRSSWFLPLIDRPSVSSLPSRFFLQRIPFIDHLAVVRSNTGIIVRADASEIAESFEIGFAIQVALIERQYKSEASPLGIAVLFY